MDTYKNAFKKAIAEGKIDKRLLPWEQIATETTARKELEKINYYLPDQLRQLPNAVLNDFRIISENIRSLAIQGSLKIIGVTSPVPRHGASTLCAILSLIVAVAGKRNGYSESIQNRFAKIDENKRPDFPVLLIDAQMKNPTLHRIFQVKIGEGLFDLLNDMSSFENVLKAVDPPELKLLTIGTNEGGQFVHRHFENFSYLLEGIKTQFEFVFVDIPAVLPYAEGIALSKLCDGVVMVVQAGETRWEVVQEARRALAKADVNVIGSILNRREYYIPNWLYQML
jgi:protein-tyrosine kinase